MFACRQKEAILFWDIYGTLQIYFFPSTLLLLVQYKTHPARADGLEPTGNSERARRAAGADREILI
jgi:hypothetical protein